MREVLIERRTEPMGRFSVEIEVANYKDVCRAEEGTLSLDKVRRVRIKGLVDTGATNLILPASVATLLGLREKEQVIVRYADNRRALRTEVRDAEVTLLGRSDVFSAIVEPDRSEALIGAIVLEVLDLLVDSKEQRLVPRDPRGITAAIGCVAIEA